MDVESRDGGVSEAAAEAAKLVGESLCVDTVILYESCALVVSERLIESCVSVKSR